MEVFAEHMLCYSTICNSGLWTRFCCFTLGQGRRKWTDFFLICDSSSPPNEFNESNIHWFCCPLSGMFLKIDISYLRNGYILTCKMRIPFILLSGQMSSEMFLYKFLKSSTNLLIDCSLGPQDFQFQLKLPSFGV